MTYKRERFIYLANIIFKSQLPDKKGGQVILHPHFSVLSVQYMAAVDSLRNLPFYGNFRTNSPGWSFQFKKKSFLEYMQHSSFWFQRCNRKGSFRDDVYLFMAPFTPENFQQPFQIMKEYSLVYIDIPFPQNFKITLLTVTQNFCLSFLALTKRKTAVLQVNIAVSVQRSNPTLWEHSMPSGTQIWKLAGVRGRRGTKRHTHKQL